MFSERAINENSTKDLNDKALINIIRGNFAGVTRNLIKNFVDKFNLFNRNNNFGFRFVNNGIKRYKRNNLYVPNDLIYISNFSEKVNSPRFIQFLLPQKSLYIILNHIYGDDFNGEYNRVLSKIDTKILKWYFNFFNELKEDDYPLSYEVTMDINSMFPLEQLFVGLDLVIGYLGMYLNGIPITEGMLRINVEMMESVVSSLYDKKKSMREQLENTKEGLHVSPFNRKLTDAELDEIVNKILKQ